ncbi:MAG: hemerythrin family protein [Syntrophaceae bacterium]|nr:hemerythrin family protein [Syntrophaceae bacterium]
MGGINQGIAWNDSFKLGNEQVDLQHKKLFELVSDLVNACMDGSDTKKLQETLGFLVNYTVRHFHFEEQLQLEYNYPEYDRHRQLHENFKITIGELVERFNKNGSSAELSNDVNKIVVGWLANHILREDKKIGEHIRNTAK